MTRRQKDPLCPLSPQEREALGAIARMHSERAAVVVRAKALLAVADGASFTAAAQCVGRRSRHAVAHLVARFNQEGLAAVEPRHGGGPTRQYQAVQQERILREFQRTPDRERDGTAVWSLTTLQRALRQAPDGLPEVSTWTILHTLWQAGYTWQQARTWCQTGTVWRKRKGESVQVTDPDTTPKKN